MAEGRKNIIFSFHDASYFHRGAKWAGDTVQLVKWPNRDSHRALGAFEEFLKANTECGRKNFPIWKGHSFGWEARRRTAVYVPFSVNTIAGRENIQLLLLRSL
jgi:hypothetical protein